MEKAGRNSRRDFCAAMPALALLLEACGPAAKAQQVLVADAQQDPAAGAQQASAAEAAKPASVGTGDGTELLKRNQVFRAAVLPMHPSATGLSQHVVQGTLLTGEGVELHNTVLLPGQEPHPPHQHVHAEFLLLREGNVEWLIDGNRQAAGPGDILYAASQVVHGIRNTGTVPAKYFVVAVGPNLKAD